MNAKAKDLFAQASPLKRAAREVFLQEACGDDAELLLEVQRLLTDSEKADAFFGDRDGATIGAKDFEEAFSEEEGDRVGPYILRQKIGEGGFGVVWMAEQSEPISRMVALKVVKAGMDTKQVLARFEAERQALAMMDHPNIARVLDAGATPAGRPYFAMELVKGIPITEFCRDQKLKTQERLALFQDVCSAVSHAHLKGVIHRDIKPSNVMVTLAADRPLAKVIDFGIAKATQNKLTDKTLFTRFEQFLGTPVYMSPEQAAMSSLDIDTRSDIYSLGVLLYELLAGQPPFDPKTLLSAGYDEMRRIIKEDEPPKPSTRLTQTQASSSHAGRNDPHITPRALQGELDWIVMKAIEKDRGRRYETANAFAADIERYLNDEPVQAGAPSTAYKFRKFARRNKATLGMTAVITLVMVVSTVVSTWQALRATDAEQLASANFQQSEIARQEAEDIAKFITEVLQSPDPSMDAREIKMVDVLKQAEADLEDGLDDHPIRRAKFRETLARVYQNLGLHADALHLRKLIHKSYLKIYESSHRETLTALDKLAWAHSEMGEPPVALDLNEEALASCRKAHGSDDPLTLDLMQSRLGIASNHGLLGDDYLALAEQLLSLRDSIHGQPSKEVIEAKHYLAHIYGGERGHELHEEIVATSSSFLGDNAGTTLWAIKCLAASFNNNSQPGEAVKWGKELVRLTRDATSDRHPATLRAKNLLAQWHLGAGQFEAAIPLLEELLVLSSTVLSENHPDTLTVMHNLGAAYSRTGQTDKAIEMKKKVLESRLRVHPQHRNTIFAIRSLAESYEGANPQEALRLHETVWKHQVERFPDHPNTLVAAGDLANTYMGIGKPEEAIWLIEKELHRRSLSPELGEPPEMVGALISLAWAYRHTKQLDKALEICKRAHDLAGKILDPTDQMLIEAKSYLGKSYSAVGEGEKESEMLEQVLEISKIKYSPEGRETLGAMTNLAGSYHQSGDLDRAIDLQRKALILKRSKLPPNDPFTSIAAANLGSFIAELRAELRTDEEKQENDEEVIVLWQEAVRIDPKNARAQYLLGTRLVSGKRFEEAAGTLQAARELYPVTHPRGHEVRALLAIALRELGQEPEAAKVIWEIDGLPTILDDQAPPVVAELIAPNSTWRWLHPTDGVDPADAEGGFHTKFFTPNYDDASWQTGEDSRGPHGGFGYGNDTRVDIGLPIEPELRKSAYFRHHFTTTEAHDNLELRCRRDDGIIIYLDGREVARDNMSPGNEAYRLSAANHVVDPYETTVFRIALRGGLAAGKHVLAISLHNAEPSSSDLSIGGITLVEVAGKATAADTIPPQN